jgi:hypothetical protein
VSNQDGWQSVGTEVAVHGPAAAWIVVVSSASTAPSREESQAG